MPFKSLLTVNVTDTDIKATINAAAAIAIDHNGHLETLALGIDRSQLGYTYIGTSNVLFEISLERAKEEAHQHEKVLAAALASQSPELRWSLDSMVVQSGMLNHLVSARARYCDLAVLAKPQEGVANTEMQQIIEAAMFDGMAPALVIPPNYTMPSRPKRIVLAWNQSREALVAARRALPLLKTAEKVIITVVDPPQHGPERSDPGGQLCQFLVRHGVKAEVAVLARSLPKVSDVLMRQCIDSAADMLVIGAYSHSRMREAILGGTTRNLLDNTTIPVFMAH